MLKLFKKELTLNVKPAVYLLSLLGTMILIPNYPIIVGIGYCIFEINIYMQFVRENLSQEFSATLPVKRSDIVGSTTLVVSFLEMATVFIASLSGIGARFIFPEGNIVGLDANFTFFGVAFLCLGVFNLVFIKGLFKTGYKYGVPIILGLVFFLLAYGVCETLVQAIPSLTTIFDGYATEYIWARAIVLAIGIAVYVGFTALANFIAVKKFEKVSL